MMDEDLEKPNNGNFIDRFESKNEKSQVPEILSQHDHDVSMESLGTRREF